MTVKIISAATLINFLVPGILFASPATDCLQSAMSDPSVLQGTKAYYAGVTGGLASVETRAVKLCAGSQRPEEALSCFKTAMEDPSILQATKAYYAPVTSGLASVEEVAIKLCRVIRAE